MKYWLKCSLLFLLTAIYVYDGFAQKIIKKTTSVTNQNSINNVLLKVIDQFDNALIQGDTNELKTLLANDLKMIHSNGLTETKQALLNHISSGYLSYSSIKHLNSPQVKAWTGKKGGYWHDRFIERNITVAGRLEGAEFNVNLKVQEHWIFDKTWKLYNRRSEKLK